MKLFVGLDVSLDKTAIWVIREHGKIMKEAQAHGECRQADFTPHAARKL